MDEEKYKEMVFEYFSNKYKKAVEEINEKYGVYFNDIFKIDEEVKQLRSEVKILRRIVEMKGEKNE